MLKPRQKILVMRYRFIGDTLLTVPFLRNLRRAYPDAEIDMLVGPNSGEILRDCPYIDELIFFDTTRRHRYENSTEKRKTFWHYIKLLREKKYDTAFVLKRSFSSAALAFLAGIPERIGFDTEGRGWLLTTKIPYDKTVHEVDSFLSILKAADIPVGDRYLESWWGASEATYADQNIAPFSHTENIVLHLTSSNPAKQWPKEHAEQLARWLLSSEKRAVHCLGAEQDSALYEELKATLPVGMKKRFHIWCGQFNLLESMAFLKKMDRVIGVDSGTLHMAAAVGIPVIALFGPMDENKWAPIGSTVITEPMACRPCNLSQPCHNAYRCMMALSVEKVIRELERSYAGLA